MTITLTTFIPGTKAKADEVNANFSVLKSAIEQKAEQNGNSTQVFSVADATSPKHAVNKGQLTDLSDSLSAKIDKTGTKFCVKSGNTSDGEGDLFSIDVYELTAKIGGTYKNLVMADYAGNQTIISTTPTKLSLLGNANGDYNIFITPEGVLYVLNNTIYRQSKRPTMTVNDIWLDISSEPFNCIKYSGSSDIIFLDVPLGKLTFKDGAITAVETFSFVQNGHEVNFNTSIKCGTHLAVSATNTIIPDYVNSVAKAIGTDYTAETNGYLLVYASQNTTTTNLYIDGVAIKAQSGSGAFSASSALWPIGKGSTYKMTGSGSLTFLPMKGLSQ